jgi:hypothetical protein
MDTNTNEDSKPSGGDEGAAAGDGGGEHDHAPADRIVPRRRRSGDALRLHDVLLVREDELLGRSSASLDALDVSPQGTRRGRRRPRSRQASEDMLTLVGRDLNDDPAGRGERDSGEAGEATGSLGPHARPQWGVDTDARGVGLPSPPLASIFGQRRPLDPDRIQEILSAALTIADAFQNDGEMQEKSERTRRDYHDNDKRPPQ